VTLHWPPIAEGLTRTVFQWGRIQSNADFVLPIVAVMGIVLFVRHMYRRDARELSPALGWLLTALRSIVFLGLLIIYLQPQWRTEREVTRNSRVMVLVDTSSSMGLTDVDAAATTGASSRVERVAAAFEETGFLTELRKKHDVVVLRFDEDLRRAASLDKLAGGRVAPNPNPAPDGTDAIDWAEALRPSGTETRLGQAIWQLVHDQRGSPLSGIVVFTDGRQNAGTPVELAIEAAREVKVPIFPVGIGSDRQPANVRVYKLEAIPRAYLGDPYRVTGLIQAQGAGGQLAGKPVTVQLLVREAADGGDARESAGGTLVDSQEVVLGGDGESVPVKFELTSRETGRKTLRLRIVPPQLDRNPNDDYRETEIEIVDRKDHVLMFAGGPTREYRFLRTQLYRDASMTVDVLLQTAAPGISQEADAILDDFPATQEAMYAYDCVVAFDPDWQALTTGQIELLEEWVAEQAGGMIVIAGPVYTGEAITGWVQDEAMRKVRALYPVEFRRRASALESGSYTTNEPWPLEFTREGLEAEYLWLADSETSNLQAWSGFAGVYSHYPVQGPKPAATVLARFSDPRARQGDRQPVYFAEQFYGSGRVFYLGSGEMWRLRRLDQTYFERFYTQLIRHVSEGRLLRQSSRGVLMVGQDRCVLGKTVPIRAALTNAQLAPLEVPAVALEVFPPDGNVQTVTLRADPSRTGMYVGQLTVLQEGVYRLELPVPESGDERITRRLHVALPDLERQNPQRNDQLLARLAEGSQGHYYDSLEAALGEDVADPLPTRLKDRTKTIIFTGASDPLWEETWLRWLMYVLCSLLCLEWFIRRLLKLA